MPEDQTMNEELKKISALLQDTSFALEAARNQEAASYASQEQTDPAFLTAKDDNATISRSWKEEKIATNIAGFYALECGIGALTDQKGGTVVEWLTRIVEQKSDAEEVLVLNRFANATWKAGQPFRSLKRITRNNFISSVFLSAEEVKKDYHQILAAADKLLPVMAELKDSSNTSQLQQLDRLLKDKQFALEMAMHLEAAYYNGRQQTAPPFLKPGEDTAIIKKSIKEEWIATNITGFYALECGLSYLATAKKKLPSGILQLIINDSISNTEKRLFERFVNATWKAGQPFLGLNRIEQKTFTPVDLLLPEEIEKDWVQIKTIARMMLRNLEK